MKKKTTPKINARISPEIHRRLEKVVRSTSLTKSQIVQEGLRRVLVEIETQLANGEKEILITL